MVHHSNESIVVVVRERFSRRSRNSPRRSGTAGRAALVAEGHGDDPQPGGAHRCHHAALSRSQRDQTGPRGKDGISPREDSAIGMSSRPGFLCPYCGQHKLGAERSTEHVLPAALGCELTTAEVCHDCNQRAGREIDDPFCRELWMHEMRHRHQVPDRRGDVPGPPVVSGTLKSDGSRILAILDRGGWWAKVIPTEEWTDAKTLQFRVDPADAPEAVAKNRLSRHRCGQSHGDWSSWGRWRVIGPQVSSTSASAAFAL